MVSTVRPVVIVVPRERAVKTGKLARDMHDRDRRVRRTHFERSRSPLDETSTDRHYGEQRPRTIADK